MGLQVILSENVPNLGSIWDIVTVSPGYGRNFLLPRKLAVVATSRNVKQFEHTKRLIAIRAEKAVDEAKAFADRLSNVSITITKAVGEEDKLFGSVTSRDIADALSAEGYTLDKRHVLLDNPIKSLGVYPVGIKCHAGVKGQIKVWVVAE